MAAPAATAAVGVLLDQALGDPLDDGRPGSFRAAVDADTATCFPHGLHRAVLDWGLAEHLVPESQGGRFHRVEDCLALTRALSRRDLTATVAIGANLLAALPVWLHGSRDQQERVAALLRDGRFLSFALSEAEHGADVLAGDVTAHRTDGGWRIDGTKWLINNAGHASAATLTARTGTGVRGLTTFLVEPPADDAGRWTVLPKIRTHGLQGSALGGMTLTGLPAPGSAVVGRPGRGLEIVLTTLQLTRVLVAGFALGALDTCLAAAVAYAGSRRLYGGPILDLDAVGRRLVDAYADLLIGETVALGASRAAHLLPDELPLMSVIVKYLVPRSAIESVESLSVVLGSRSYLRDGHWHGIVEKMRRDCAVTALFDGSEPVTLDAIAEQLPTLAQARAAHDVGPVPLGLYAAADAGDLPWLAELDFELAAGRDSVLGGLAAAAAELRSAPGTLTCAPELTELLDRFAARVVRLDAEVVGFAAEPGRRRSGAAFDLAAEYAQLHAAAACALRWLAERPDPADDFAASGGQLLLCLRRLATRTGSAPAGLHAVDRAALARLVRSCAESRWPAPAFPLPTPAIDRPSGGLS